MRSNSHQRTEIARSGEADTVAASPMLDAARAGSSEALGRLLEEYQNYLLLVAHREIGDDLRAKAGASDIVQETFLEAQRDFHRFVGSTPGEFRGWLRRLLLNNMANVARRYTGTGKRDPRREVVLERDDSSTGMQLTDALPTPSRILVAEEEQRELLDAIHRLPDHYRDAILLRHRDGMSYAEIGEKLGRTPEAVRKLWARAVELLQELLEADASRAPLDAAD
jgi:RNA polymerase sigma-70 factor (ECF subfamily)